ncbi:MAG: 2-C-methyl-D-erythritol 2,4-cyclodiphosphate synthase [Clostridia bacterium]|nr:2-C-methyl-D-erythritol 2,4-cyclodiphosphate synthase [Clostridia bacterium]
MNSNQVWAIVVAAGRGERFGKPYNKVFHLIDGQSILTRCLTNLSSSNAFDGIILVISEQDEAPYAELTAREGVCPLVRSVVYGGATRQESVMNGLRALPESVRYVAVHDAARPFTAHSVIHALVNAAAEYGAAIPGTPMTDTVKIMDREVFSVETPDRSTLCAVQTPQIFNREKLLQAHSMALNAGVPATDDASLYERFIGRVKVVMTPECADNIKVTTQQDIRRPGHFIIPRAGHGYDAHRLTEGRDLILCGVKIPYEKGLLGHSDADVAVHALMDAMLGAAAMGDIGRHFPDSDPQYRGISSIKLLNHVVALLETNGLAAANADVTIVAQRPKLKNYMDEMKNNICEALSLPEDRVNIKATTTEGMGFEGEGLGISAQAVVMLIPSEALS